MGSSPLPGCSGNGFVGCGGSVIGSYVSSTTIALSTGDVEERRGGTNNWFEAATAASAVFPNKHTGKKLRNQITSASVVADHKVIIGRGLLRALRLPYVGHSC